MVFGPIPKTARLISPRHLENSGGWELRLTPQLEALSRMFPDTLKIEVKAENLDLVIKMVERILPNRCKFPRLGADHRYFVFQRKHVRHRV